MNINKIVELYLSIDSLIAEERTVSGTLLLSLHAILYLLYKMPSFCFLYLYQ